MIDFKNKKVALYGGSFNPVHIGHIITGYEIIEKLNYDYVIFIPANIPVHKNFNNAVDAGHRINMLKLSIKNIKNFLFSDVEIKRGGYSYTIDTVKELADYFNYKKKFGVVFGDDLYNDLHLWKNIDELSKISDLICLKRNNIKLNKNKYNVKIINNRVIELSSTEIRNRIKNNLTVYFMIANEVKKYIMKNNLYKG